MIDIQTFMLALAIGNISFAVLMAGYTDGASASPGLRLWMWARLCLGAAQLLGFLTPQLGLPVLGLIEPIGWAAGVALEVAAYCVFFGFRRWRRALFGGTGVAIALVVGARGTGASTGQITVLIAVILAVFAAVLAVILLRPRRRGVSLLQRIIGLNHAAFALAMALWGWTGAMHGPLATIAASPVQGIAYLSGYLLMIVNGFGFLLLCKQKDDAQMERLATVDFLTGLLNRRAFFERAEASRMLATRLNKPIALMMLDIDHFKQLNDRFGHATGDTALVLFADTARGGLREHDLMGRLGGEEFALALPGTDLEGALQAAERLRAAVTETPLQADGAVYEMTVSIGVVMIERHEALTAALARADHALYAAKRGGRDRVEVGQPMPIRA